VAVIWVELTQEEESIFPFHCTVALFAKFEPNKTKLTEEAPAVVLEGAMEVRAGMFCGVPLPPPGLPFADPPPQPTRKNERRAPRRAHACRVIVSPETS
jgi:hypothetical protein